MEKIDFVITWVDGSDKKWLKEKEKFTNKCDSNGDDREIRYRDWDSLKYWFRGVQKFAPWVNKIYFITYGHLPKWLNLNNPKLVIINHKDYMDKKYLPTFNSIPIELNMHKIKGLSENFVYFNDDMFLIKETKPKDFFRKGLPCDSGCLSAITPINPDRFDQTLSNNVYIINKHFELKDVLRKNPFKWFNFRYGQYAIKNIILSGWEHFIGFRCTHLPVSYKKSVFEDVWEVESDYLDEISTQKFRNNCLCVNHFVMQDWQLATGKFSPRKLKFGQYFDITSNNENLIKAIKKQSYKCICINDNDDIKDFNKVKQEINNAFETILKEKSDFEI